MPILAGMLPVGCLANESSRDAELGEICRVAAGVGTEPTEEPFHVSWKMRSIFSRAARPAAGASPAWHPSRAPGHPERGSWRAALAAKIPPGVKLPHQRTTEHRKGLCCRPWEAVWGGRVVKQRAARGGVIKALVAAALIGGAGVAMADGDDAGPDPAESLPSVDASGPGRSGPGFGLFYQRYEPTFYTGFAPRALEPERVHLHIGRGNQLRATLVLSDEVLRSYAQDLLARQRTLRGLIGDGEIELTQNTAFEAMEAIHESIGLDALVAAEARMTPAAIRDRNLALLERLNPGRVFRIRIPIDALVGRWIPLAVAAPSPLSADAKRDLLDALLPTRLYTDAKRLAPATVAKLEALIAEAARPGPPAAGAIPAELRRAYADLLAEVSGGRYPLRGDALEFVEFTALYPIGTVNELTKHRGREIPLYPTPGRRELTTHQRSLTADHIADVPTYSYSPWLPYMHVGSKMHNAFHTPYWDLRLANASFLPAELRRLEVRGRSGTKLSNAYLLSRGPASHGCTHVNPGHLVELRQMLPSETERLDEVEVFLNESHTYDVFDIDGDLSPEVMGVRYFVAYSIVNDEPAKMRAPIERAAFYDWLYGGGVELDREGRAFVQEPKDANFEGAKAVEGDSYPRLPLYEAVYEPERVQFYATRPIPFVRELRKVGAHHPFSRERARSGRSL